jgi:hypothetical protein
MGVFSARHFIIGQNGTIINGDGALWTLENCGFPLAFIERNKEPHRALAEALGHIEDTLEPRLRMMGESLMLSHTKGDAAARVGTGRTMSVDDPFLDTVVRNLLEGGPEQLVRALKHLAEVAHDPENMSTMTAILKNHPLERRDALAQQEAVGQVSQAFSRLPGNYLAHLTARHVDAVLNPNRPSGAETFFNHQYIEVSPHAVGEPKKLTDHALEEGTHFLDKLYALLVPSCGQSCFTNTPAWQDVARQTLGNPRSILLINRSNEEGGKVSTLAYPPLQRPAELLPDIVRLMATGVQDFKGAPLLDNIPPSSELHRFMAREFGDTYKLARGFLAEMELNAPEVKVRGDRPR